MMIDNANGHALVAQDFFKLWRIKLKKHDRLRGQQILKTRIMNREFLPPLHADQVHIWQSGGIDSPGKCPFSLRNTV